MTIAGADLYVTKRSKMKYITLSILILVAIMACANLSSSKKSSQEVAWAEIAQQLRKGQDVYLENKTITGDVKLYEAGRKNIKSRSSVVHQISANLVLVDCIIEGPITAYEKGQDGSRFTASKESIRLIGCQLMEQVNLDNIVIAGDMTLSETIIHKHFSAVSSRIKGDLLMNDLHAAGDLMLAEIQVDGYINLFQAEVGGITTFQRAWIGRDLQASAVTWNGYADFSQIRCVGAAYFNYSEFMNKVVFNNGYFRDRFELVDCTFHQSSGKQKVCTVFAPVMSSLDEEGLSPQFTLQCTI